MDLRLVEDDPPTGPAAAALEWRPELLAEDTRGLRVRARGARAQMQLAIDDLRHLVVRRAQDVLVRRAGRGGLHHTESLARFDEVSQPRRHSRLERRRIARVA